jgi:hypothetical protein
MDEELKELLKKNVEMTEEILKISKMLKRNIVFQQIYGIIKVIFIVVPIVLGIIYLPTIYNNLTEMYQEILKMPNLNSVNQNVLNQISPELIKKLLK